jgi:hypothetical protein
MGTQSKLPPIQHRLLTRRQVAEMFGVTKQYLAKLAMRGEGPRFKIIGKQAMYMLEDVNAWWESLEYRAGGKATPSVNADDDAPSVVEAVEPELKPYPFEPFRGKIKF